jgi:iron(III) transport system substrate-binding protein
MPASGAAVWSSIQALPKDQRLAALEQEAKREGKLVWYGSFALDRAEVFINLFTKQYPQINVEYVRLGEAEVQQRVVLEHRTDRVGADLILTNVAYLDIIKDAVAPFEPLTWSDFDSHFLFGSYKDGWTAVAIELLMETISWRTDRVTAADAPRTLDALMNPKFKGRTGTTVNMERFVDAMVQVYGPQTGMEKVRALAALNSRMYKSYAAASDGFASGEVDIMWAVLAHRPVKLKAEGAPVDFVYQQPAFGSANTFSALRGSRNPYAAALFMEFTTRPEILEAMDKIEGGRMFGHRAGKFALKVSDYPNLTLYRPLPESEFKRLNRTVENLFVRRAN